jgi:phospholipase/lecithinase/hemolysin
MRASIMGAIIFRLTVLASAILLISSTAHAATGEPKNYVLGDSLSDVGALGITYTNSQYEPGYPRVWGKVWVQDIPEYASTSTFCLASTCPPDPQVPPFYYTQKGNNYAVGGAGVLFDTTDLTLSNRTYTDLPSQVSALIHNAGYTPSSNKQDHIFIWIGGNDIAYAAALLNDEASKSVVRAASSAYTNAVSALAGACPQCKIYVISIPYLGDTPLAQWEASKRKLNALTHMFNDEISILQSSRVTYIEINQYLNAQNLGTDLRTWCTTGIDPGHICPSPENPIKAGSSATIYADPAAHPITTIHAYIAGILKHLFVL